MADTELHFFSSQLGYRKGAAEVRIQERLESNQRIKQVLIKQLRFQRKQERLRNGHEGQLTVESFGQSVGVRRIWGSLRMAKTQNVVLHLDLAAPVGRHSPTGKQEL